MIPSLHPIPRLSGPRFAASGPSVVLQGTRRSAAPVGTSTPTDAEFESSARRRRVAVVGGGLSGLAAAVRLQEARVSVTLFEASHRLGGVIQSYPGEGFVVEEAAAVLSPTPAAVALCRRLGIGLAPAEVDSPFLYPGEGGGPLLATPRGGMVAVVEGLAAEIQDTTVLLDTSIQSIGRKGDEWVLTAADDVTWTFDAVVLAVPTPAATYLSAPLDAELAAELAAIPTTSAASVHLIWRTSDFGVAPECPEIVSAQGDLVSSISITEVATVGGDPHLLVRALIDDDEAVLSMDEEELFLRVWGEVAERYDVRTAPASRHVARFAHVIPRLDPAHGRRLDRIEARLDSLPGLAVAGAAIFGPGVANCISAGTMAARRVLGTP